MPESSQPDEMFRSGDSLIWRLVGPSMFIIGVMLAFLSDYPEAGALLAGLGGVLAWQGYQSKNRPFVRIGCEYLIVCEQGKVRYYIHLQGVAQLRKGLNKTILMMQDGEEIAIGHFGFVSTEEALRFRKALEKIILKSGNQPAAGNAGIAPRLANQHHRPGVPEPGR